MANSKRNYFTAHLPGLLLPVPPSPEQATAEPHLYRRPPTLAGRSGSVSWRVTAPVPWVLVYTRFVCAFQEWSLFPPSCGRPTRNQIPLVFKLRFLGDSQSLCWIPRLGSLTWSSEPSQQWEKFFGITVLVCGLLIQQVWDLILSLVCPSYHLTVASSLSLGMGYLFLVGSSVLLLMAVQPLVVTEPEVWRFFFF